MMCVQRRSGGRGILPEEDGSARCGYHGMVQGVGGLHYSSTWSCDHAGMI
jgi:hypothetical protein